MKTVLKTAPSGQPVDIEELKQHLRVTIDEDDDVITVMGAAACQLAENITQQKFITQTWYGYFDNLPFARLPLWDGKIGARCIPLPFLPVISVDAFDYQSAAGVWTAVDATTYYVDQADKSRIILTDALPDPAVDASAFRITFTAGYGAASAVPEQIRLAIKTFVLHFYENRGAFDVNNLMSVPQAGSNLLDPYKIPRN